MNHIYKSLNDRATDRLKAEEEGEQQDQLHLAAHSASSVSCTQGLLKGCQILTVNGPA